MNSNLFLQETHLHSTCFCHDKYIVCPKIHRPKYFGTNIAGYIYSHKKFEHHARH